MGPGETLRVNFAFRTFLPPMSFAVHITGEVVIKSIFASLVQPNNFPKPIFRLTDHLVFRRHASTPWLPTETPRIVVRQILALPSGRCAGLWLHGT